MEVIRLPGYTEDEKLEIALRHLIPRQFQENGLTPEDLHHYPGGDKRRSSPTTPGRRA